MRASELHIGRPELMTSEELEDNESAHDIPLWYRTKMLESLACTPDEEGRSEFLKRKPALGFSLEEVELLHDHVHNLLPVQRRLFNVACSSRCFRTACHVVLFVVMGLAQSMIFF